MLVRISQRVPFSSLARRISHSFTITKSTWKYFYSSKLKINFKNTETKERDTFTLLIARQIKADGLD